MIKVDEWVERLSFGTGGPKISSCLGLYLSPELACVAETRVESDGTATSKQLVKIPIPADSRPSGPVTATLNADFLSDTDRVLGAIEQALGQGSWSTKNVLVTLSQQLGLTRYFVMPAIDKQFWRMAIPLEAKKYIPIPFDNLSHDYQVFPITFEGGRAALGVLFGVSQRRNTLAISELAQRLGLNLVGIEASACSAVRLRGVLEPELLGQSYVHVHFEKGQIHILIADHGIPIFFREVFLGPECSVSDLRKLDLVGCVSFARKHLSNGELGQVRITGVGADLKGWQEAISQELGLPVSISDPGATLKLTTGDWASFAAIGASLRHTVPSIVTLDLGQVGRVNEDEIRTARNMLLACGLLGLWFTLLGVYKAVRYQWDVRELNSYQKSAEIEAALSGKGPKEIEEMIREMEAQLQVLEPMDRPRNKATDVIREIVSALPEKVWLTKISVRSPLGGGDLLEINLQGRATGENTAQEQDLALQFKDRASSSPGLNKIFRDNLQITINKNPIQEIANMDPDLRAQTLEQRTSFELSGRTPR